MNLKTKISSLIVGGLVIVSINSTSAYTIQSQPVNSGDKITKTLWNKIVSDLVGIKGDITNSGSSIWTAVTGGINYDGGNVGIGTISPSAKLEVSGNIIASLPIANNHVATKEYVDSKVSASNESRKHVYVLSIDKITTHKFWTTYPSVINYNYLPIPISCMNGDSKVNEQTMLLSNEGCQTNCTNRYRIDELLLKTSILCLTGSSY